MFNASLSTLKPHSLQTSGRIRYYILFMLELFWTWISHLPSQLIGFLFSQPVLSKQNVWLSCLLFLSRRPYRFLHATPCLKELEVQASPKETYNLRILRENSVQSSEMIKNRKVKKASCLMTPSNNSLKTEKPHHAWVHVPALISRGCVRARSVLSDSSRPHGL